MQGRGPAGGIGHAKNPMYDKPGRMPEHGFKVGYSVSAILSSIRGGWGSYTILLVGYSVTALFRQDGRRWMVHGDKRFTSSLAVLARGYWVGCDWVLVTPD